MCGKSSRLGHGSVCVLVRALCLAAAVLMQISQEAVTVAQTPSATAGSYRRVDDGLGYTGEFSEIALAIDSFWSATFAAEGRPYQAPVVESLDQLRQTPCGMHGPASAALYCQLDLTIYLSPAFLAEQHESVGDYAPIIVLAHEWGHHVQYLLRVPDPGGNTYELQADCLAGVFTAHAEESGFLEPGDFIEALAMSEESGDPLWIRQDSPRAHGTYADRRNAVMRGYLDGMAGCGLSELESSGQVPKTPTPTPTPTMTLTSTPTALPTPPLRELWLPDSPPVSHSACFDINEDGEFTMDDVVGRLGDMPDGSDSLERWGWSQAVYRTYGCDGPPQGDAGWFEINLHRFGDASAARASVDYFAAARAAGTRLLEVDPPQIGDHAAALIGPAVNGTDVTVYASLGPLLIRVTGVSPTGIPFDNVSTVAQEVLVANQSRLPVDTGRETQSVPTRPATDHLPETPAINYAECFQVIDRGTYAFGDVVEVLENVGVSRVEADELEWTDGAYVVFRCAEPPFGRANQLEVVIHQFHDAPSAFSHFNRMSVLGEHESRACDTDQTLVVCVYGRSDAGSPLSDVHFVLNQVIASIR